MPDVITAREANQSFSRLLRQVSEGREFLITNRGTPVAVLSPPPAASGRRVLSAVQEQALANLVTRALNHRLPDDAEPITPFDRDAIYDRRNPDRLGDAD